ncbi:MAG: hypothetical protein PVJ63_01885 [Thioalkalispiraceae bacterium]|jgi:hypothetical protein
MAQIANLSSSELSVDIEYLKQLQPLQHLDRTCLQVLLHTARFNSMFKGEKLPSQVVKKYLVYLVDGKMEKANDNLVQRFDSTSREPVFQDNEHADATALSRSMVVMIDKNLFGIFKKEMDFKELLNLSA